MILANNIRDLKKSQMYPDILKTKTGLQDAYFDKQFKRLYENEREQWNKRLFQKRNTSYQYILYFILQ